MKISNREKLPSSVLTEVLLRYVCTYVHEIIINWCKMNVRIRFE